MLSDQSKQQSTRSGRISVIFHLGLKVHSLILFHLQSYILSVDKEPDIKVFSRNPVWVDGSSSSHIRATQTSRVLCFGQVLRFKVRGLCLEHCVLYWFTHIQRWDQYEIIAWAF